MPHINLEKLWDDAWQTIRTFVVSVYTMYPIPAWGITLLVLLLILYRFARFQHQYGEYKKAQQRQRKTGKPSGTRRTSTRHAGRQHKHDHDKRQPEAHKARRYGSKKEDRLDNWD